MIAKIKKWLQVRRHKKEFKKIQTALVSNPKLLLKTQAKYEKVFGTNSRTRNYEQWQRLVNVYGIEKVAQVEQITEAEVKKMMIETYDQKLKRRLKGV